MYLDMKFPSMGPNGINPICSSRNSIWDDFGYFASSVFSFSETKTHCLSRDDRLLPTDDLQVLQVMQDLAVNAMTDLVAATKDVIFLCGRTADHAFLKINGPLSALG